MDTGSSQTAAIIAVLVDLINLNQAERDFVNGCHLCNFLGGVGWKGQLKKKGTIKICALRDVLHVTREEL